MNVCVLYSGLPRTYQFCLPNHHNSFWKKYNITDCYVHFWIENGNHTAPWSLVPYIPSVSSEIIETFKAKRIALEKDNFPFINEKLKYPYDFSKFTKKEILNQCLLPIKSNATSIRNAWNLVKDLDYDYYILARPDMLWSENLNDWPELNGTDNYYYWDTLWIFKKNMLEMFANKLEKIDEYATILLETQKDKETQDYNFITSEAVNDLHFKKNGISLDTFIPIRMKKQIHRGSYIQN